MVNTTDNWLVYLLKCSDGTLYCGVTNNLKKRVLAHNSGKGAKYTRGRKPVTVIAFSCFMSKSRALSTERKVKSLQKDKKSCYIKSLCPNR